MPITPRERLARVLDGSQAPGASSAQRDGLGLRRRARLRAEPHALLVYGKGQFFLPHQDSEKDDTMIGTLVVSLPSPHTGGKLLIEHNDQTVAYDASATEISVAAFYADCRHQVKPVRTGYRVTYTCNLLLESDPPGAVPAEPAAEAARYLTKHFTTRVSRWKGDDQQPARPSWTRPRYSLSRCCARWTPFTWRARSPSPR